MKTQNEVMTYATEQAHAKGFSTVWSFLGDLLAKDKQKKWNFAKQPKNTWCKCRGAGKENFWKVVPYNVNIERVFCLACCKFVAKEKYDTMGK